MRDSSVSQLCWSYPAIEIPLCVRSRKLISHTCLSDATSRCMFQIAAWSGSKQTPLRYCTQSICYPKHVLVAAYRPPKSGAEWIYYMMSHEEISQNLVKPRLKFNRHISLKFETKYQISERLPNCFFFNLNLVASQETPIGWYAMKARNIWYIFVQ